MFMPLASCDWRMPQGSHTTGMNIAMVDGSGRTVTSSMSGTTWWAMCTPNGGEVIPGDF
jgi:prepilin-type processing-associated H-X9-DG protein